MAFVAAIQKFKQTLAGIIQEMHLDEDHSFEKDGFNLQRLKYTETNPERYAENIVMTLWNLCLYFENGIPTDVFHFTENLNDTRRIVTQTELGFAPSNSVLWTAVVYKIAGALQVLFAKLLRERHNNPFDITDPQLQLQFKAFEEQFFTRLLPLTLENLKVGQNKYRREVLDKLQEEGVEQSETQFEFDDREFAKPAIEVPDVPVLDQRVHLDLGPIINEVVMLITEIAHFTSIINDATQNEGELEIASNLQRQYAKLKASIENAKNRRMLLATVIPNQGAISALLDVIERRLVNRVNTLQTSQKIFDVFIQMDKLNEAFVPNSLNRVNDFLKNCDQTMAAVKKLEKEQPYVAENPEMQNAKIALVNKREEALLKKELLELHNRYFNKKTGEFAIYLANRKLKYDVVDDIQHLGEKLSSAFFKADNPARYRAEETKRTEYIKNLNQIFLQYIQAEPDARKYIYDQLKAQLNASQQFKQRETEDKKHSLQNTVVGLNKAVVVLHDRNEDRPAPSRGPENR